MLSVTYLRCEYRANLLGLDVPPNTQATVYIPAAEGTTILEGEQPIAAAEGGAAIYAVQSGQYDNRMQMTPKVPKKQNAPLNVSGASSLVRAS